MRATLLVRAWMALAGAVLGARALDAQSVDAAVRNCRAQALPRLRAIYPSGGEVRLAPEVATAMYYNQGAVIGGAGLVQEPGLAGWRTFTYQCYWKVQTRQSFIVVQVDSTRVFP